MWRRGVGASAQMCPTFPFPSVKFFTHTLADPRGVVAFGAKVPVPAPEIVEICRFCRMERRPNSFCSDEFALNCTALRVVPKSEFSQIGEPFFGVFSRSVRGRLSGFACEATEIKYIYKSAMTPTYLSTWRQVLAKNRFKEILVKLQLAIANFSGTQ